MLKSRVSDDPAWAIVDEPGSTSEAIKEAMDREVGHLEKLDDPGGIKATCDGAKPGKPMTEEEIKVRMDEFSEKLDTMDIPDCIHKAGHLDALDEPVFEVGDILTVGEGDECEHEVLAQPTEDWWCVSNYDRLFNTADLHDHFSLLRKGLAADLKWAGVCFNPDGSPEDVLRRLRKEYKLSDTPEPEDNHDFYYSPDGKLMLAIRTEDVIMYKLSEPRDPATAEYDGVFKKW